MIIPNIKLSKRNIIVVSIISAFMTLACFVYIVTDTRSSQQFDMTLDSQDARPSYKHETATHCRSNTAQHVNVTKAEWEQCLNAGEKPEYYLSIVIVTRMDDYAG